MFRNEKYQEIKTNRNTKSYPYENARANLKILKIREKAEHGSTGLWS